MGRIGSQVIDLSIERAGRTVRPNHTIIIRCFKLKLLLLSITCGFFWAPMRNFKKKMTGVTYGRPNDVEGNEWEEAMKNTATPVTNLFIYLNLLMNEAYK